jgi:hypothetical protein
MSANVKTYYTFTSKSNTADGVSGLLTAYNIFLNFPLCPGAPHGLMFYWQFCSILRNNFAPIPPCTTGGVTSTNSMHLPGTRYLPL